MKVAVVGRGKKLLTATRRIASEGHDVALVVTGDPAEHHKVGVPEFRDLATDLDARFSRPDDINAAATRRRIEAADCDVAVSLNWKTVIDRSVLDLFPHGILNVHAGDLPRYRGNATANWAIVEGEDEVVFTLHRMNEALDAGPILLKERMEITEATTIGDVTAFGEREVPDLIVRGLNGLADGSLEPHSQPEAGEEVLRCYPRAPRDSRLEWERPARDLDRVVRASTRPLFGAYTYLDGEKVTIWETHVEEPSTSVLGVPGQVADLRPADGEVAVVTGEDFLVLEAVETADSGRTEATDVVSSHRARLGMDVTGEIERLRERIDGSDE